MVSQTGKQIITITYCPRSKDSISKYISGQLIESKRINIFPVKSHIKWGGEASPRPFHKKLKFRIPLGQQPKMLHILF